MVSKGLTNSPRVWEWGGPSKETTLPDSGARSEFATGAVRDAMVGKGLPSLIPPCAIRALARRFEDGATKYGRDNWQKGIPLSRYVDAIFRHTMAMSEGQDGEDHAGAVLWNAAAFMWTLEAIRKGSLPRELNDLTYFAGEVEVDSQMEFDFIAKGS